MLPPKLHQHGFLGAESVTNSSGRLYGFIGLLKQALHVGGNNRKWSVSVQRRIWQHSASSQNSMANRGYN